VPSYEIKNFDISDKEVIVKFDRKKFENDEDFIEYLVCYVDRNAKLSENSIKFLIENINKIRDAYSYFSCLEILINNNCKVEVPAEVLNELNNRLDDFDYWVWGYDLLKKHNTLDEEKERIIVKRLADKFPYNKFTYNLVNYHEKDIERILRKYSNSHRDLIAKVVKEFVSGIYHIVIENIPIWLDNPKRYQNVSYFLMLVRLLKKYGLDSVIQKEIELFKNRLLNEYKDNVKSVIKRRIKNDNYKEEMKTLIEILEDRSLYKYLL